MYCMKRSPELILRVIALIVQCFPKASASGDLSRRTVTCFTCHGRCKVFYTQSALGLIDVKGFEKFAESLVCTGMG